MNLNSGSRINKEETVLLLTGAINILHRNVPFTFATDLEQRLSQYLYSIEYSIDHYHSIDNIVFCENSNYAHDYASLIEKAKKNGKKLEILTFEGNYPIIQNKGKGYGEGEIIEYALKNSTLLKDCHSFYKLTGRLAIKNFDQIVDSTKVENAFIWRHKVIYQMKTDYVETFFYKVNKEFYTTRLLHAYKEVDEINHLYIEHLFNERLKKLKIRSFRYPLQIIGNSGSSGRPYIETRNFFLMEKICFAIGAQHMQKNAFERILTDFFAWLIKTRKKFRQT